MNVSEKVLNLLMKNAKQPPHLRADRVYGGEMVGGCCPMCRGCGLVGGAQRGRPRKNPQPEAMPMPKPKKAQNCGLQHYQSILNKLKAQGYSHKDAVAAYKEMKATNKSKYGIEGAGWDDFAYGFSLPFKAASKVVPFIL